MLWRYSEPEIPRKKNCPQRAANGSVSVQSESARSESGLSFELLFTLGPILFGGPESASAFPERGSSWEVKGALAENEPCRRSEGHRSN